MRDGEADFKGLEELCRELIGKNGMVVEIGCYMGESSSIIARYAEKLYCIDRWKDGLLETGSVGGSRFEYREMAKVQGQFDAALEGKSNVIKIQGHSNDLADVLGNDLFDLVYIDALHSYEAVCNDIWRWWPKIKQGGYIGGHNFSVRWPGVTRAVREAFGNPDKVYRDSSWIVRKMPLRKKREDACIRWTP